MSKTIEVKIKSVNGNAITTEQNETYVGEGKVEQFIKDNLVGQRVTLSLKSDDEKKFTFLQKSDQKNYDNQKSQQDTQPKKTGYDQNITFKTSYAKDIVVAMINQGLLKSEKEINDQLLREKLFLDEVMDGKK